ncbi:MAG: peptidoglycan DD-metalloendopeptidase family protein [Oscillospiraceae bacterium]|nr:peptidoglycan DD-metalloendopeptidase family protein [Oscillospiraceae bacterium]
MSISTWKKALAVCLAAVTVFVTAQSAGQGEMTAYVSASAATIAELEARKQENHKKIQACESKLAEFSESEKKSKAYQAALQDKIDALQSNMQILDTELEDVKKKIFALDLNISSMEQTIQEQQTRIEKGLEEFKLRLRAMYVNGSDSLASVLVGATDFYDLLSKYEVISCVAKHDNELVNDLKQELESYSENLELLESQKAEQEQAQAEKKAKQSEMQASMQELRNAYADSEAEQERLALEKASANKTIAELEEDNKLAEQAEAEIREQIRRADEERRRKESEEAAKALQQTTVSTSSDSKNTTRVFVKSTVKNTTQTTTQTKTESESATQSRKSGVEDAPGTAPVMFTKPAETSTTEGTTVAVTIATTVAKTAKVTTTTKSTTTTTTTEALPPVTAPEIPATVPPTEPPTEMVTEPVTETVTETIMEAYDESTFIWPCPEHYYISSGFGSRWGTNHKGIDIAQNAGADAVASRAGKVIKVNTSCTHNYGKNKNCCGNGYGNYVLIDHEDGTYSTMYAHLQTVLVSVGDYVEKEQTIGYVGTTGHSTGYHLHFEIRKDGTAVNPDDYLNYELD